MRASRSIDAGLDGAAVGRRVAGRPGDEGELGRVLAPGRRLLRRRGVAHGDGAARAHGLDPGQQRLVAVDVALQLGALEAEACGIDEHRRIAGIDQGGLDPADAGNVEQVDMIAGREGGAGGGSGLGLGLVVGGIEELELDLGRRKGHAVELEVAQLLDLAAAHGHVADDLLADVGLPDANGGRAVGRGADQAHADRARADGGAEVAAIARPVDQRLVDGHLAEQVVDVAILALRFRQDDDLAGARGRAAHAVGMLAVAVGAADHAHQDAVALVSVRRQVLGEEEDPLAGAAAHVDGGNAELFHESLELGARC